MYLLVLVLLAGIIYWSYKSDQEFFSDDEANFKIKRTEQIDDIFLSDKTNNKIHLHKIAKNNWIVNDSFKVRQDWMDLLLDAFQHQQTTQVVPESAHDNVIRQMAGSGIKTEIYAANKLINAFYVSINPSPLNQTYMLKIKADGKNALRPYIVSYGQGGTFVGTYYKTDIDIWRDKRLFDLTDDGIENISMSYYDNPEFDFKINTNPLSVLRTKDDTESRTLNTDRVQTFLGFFPTLFHLGFENSYSLKDTFIKSFQPVVHIEMLTEKKVKKDLKIYYRPVHKGTSYIIKVRGGEFDGDSFFALLNERDFVLINKKTVTKLLRSYDEFYETDKK